MASFIIPAIDGKDIYRVERIDFDGDFFLTVHEEKDLPDITAGEHIFTIDFVRQDKTELLLKTPVEIVGKDGTTLKLRMTDEEAKKEILKGFHREV